jgi:hypothetical protein
MGVLKVETAPFYGAVFCSAINPNVDGKPRMIKATTAQQKLADLKSVSVIVGYSRTDNTTRILPARQCGTHASQYC